MRTTGPAWRNLQQPVYHRTGSRTNRHSLMEPPDRYEGEAGSNPEIPLYSPDRTRTVLFMDDEESIREAYGCLLEKKGYSVLSARDGNEAVDIYRSAMAAGTKIDVVVIDLTIPGGMGGIETIRQLKELDPDVRALVSSGLPQDQLRADYTRYGFAGVIPKPYSWKDLLSAIERAIRQG